MHGKTRFAMAGFSLIEMMIVVVVIAILAGIAYPGYQEYIRRGNRAEATAALLESATRMQQFYTINNSYIGTSGPLKDSTRYTVSHAADSPTATTYTLQAVPISGYSDPKCGTFTVDQTGQRGMTGTYTGTIADCWGNR